MGFPRWKYWSGLPFPSPGDLPDPGIELMSPALASGFFTTQPPGKFPLHYEKESIVTQSCPTLCNSMDYSPPGSSVHGVLQARILKWITIPFFRKSSRPSDRTWVRQILYHLSHQGSYTMQQSKFTAYNSKMTFWGSSYLCLLLCVVRRMCNPWYQDSLQIISMYIKRPIKYIYIYIFEYIPGLPWWFSGKESICQCKRHRDSGLIPGKIPWNRKWQPTPVSLPGESHGRRSLAGYSSWVGKELDMTEHTHRLGVHVF